MDIKMRGFRVCAVLALAGVVLVGCSGKRPQPLVPGAELVTIGKGDVVTGYQYLGEVTGVNGHGCGLFGYRGTYAGAVANLRNRAHAMGANYVQIMSQTQPFPAYNCFVNEYIIEATAYRIPGTATPQAGNPAATPEPSRIPTWEPVPTRPAGQPAAAAATTKEQQLQELQNTQGLSYEEYQRRFKAIEAQ